MNRFLPILVTVCLPAWPTTPGGLDSLAADAKSYGVLMRPAEAGKPAGDRIPAAPRPTPWQAWFPAEGPGLDGKQLIRLLVEVASKGGKFGLELDTHSAHAARNANVLMDWLHGHGEAVKEVSPSPFRRTPFFGRATVRGNVLYLHLFAWPASGKLEIPGLNGEILKAEMVQSGKAVSWTRSRTVTTLQLPGPAPEQPVPVVRVTLKSAPSATPFFFEAGTAGRVDVTMVSCEIESPPGRVASVEQQGGRLVFANWTRAVDVPTWHVHVPVAGRYAVQMRYQADLQSAGVVYTVTMKGETVGMTKGVVQVTGAGPKLVPVGDMELDPGNYVLLVQAEPKPGQTAMLLEGIVLRRIGD